MVTLRLFHTADPFRPIETRTLSEGEIVLGRDPAADWPIADAACELSRRHCAIGVGASGVFVRDMSANGVFYGPARKRLDKDAVTPFKPGEQIHLGQFMVVIEAAPAPANDATTSADASSLDAPFHSPMLQEPAVSAAAFMVRSAWSGPTDTANAAPSGRLPDAALLEAFCEGAGLDPSLFMGEDPAEVLRRAGAVYQQAVLGVCDLMSERTSLKTAYQMNRTTVGASDNNPFKWGDAHRVGVDLLRSKTGPFLGGAAAVNQSFQDLKKHLLCLMAGSRAAIAAAFEELKPSKVEEGIQGQSLLFQTKVDACWREFQKRHGELMSDAQENVESAVNRAFKTGYEKHVRKLDGLGTVS